MCQIQQVQSLVPEFPVIIQLGARHELGQLVNLLADQVSENIAPSASTLGLAPDALELA